MSSNGFCKSDSSKQKLARIHGYEYKIYSNGSIFNFEEASASMGNILESKELLSKYHPEVLKFSILSNFSKDSETLTTDDIITSEKRFYYFYQTLDRIKNFANENSELNEHIALYGRIIKPEIVDGINGSFVAAINDNFNTALAVSNFLQVFKYSNALLNNTNENPLHKLTTLNKIYKNILIVANLLGIFLEEPEAFIMEMKEKYIKLNNINMKEVKELMDLRQEAKLNKNFELSDELKSKLDQNGIIIRDSAFGSEWDIKELFV
ncbi:MAG: cysteinyl-tRNA synthetase [Eubacterium sp.]|nr:cysteinyl-tRNA synthetase [Eubacterium sp.]